MIFSFHKNLIAKAPKVFWAFTLLFFISGSVAIYFEIYFIWAIALLLPILYYSIFEFEKLYFFAVFFTPFSLGLQWIFPQIPFNISLPSEILMLALLGILILKIIQGNLFPASVFKHPLGIAVIIYLVWIGITSISSSMPLVSFKYLISQCWFVFALFFLPVLLFQNKKNIYLFFGTYIFSFTCIIIYTINNLLTFGLYDNKAAHFVMQPFYNDHTSYGAILAMFIPVLIGSLFLKNRRPLFRIIIAALSILFCIALVLSYTRAAWISILAAGVLALIIKAKIKMRLVLTFIFILSVYLFLNRFEILDKLHKNRQDSSVELANHIKSMSNIATDASNLERINRWNCAIEMFKQRPVLGWGPGAYMFQYAPFQKARDKTIISTNFAEAGNAHSEYIGRLAEQGVFGFLCYSSILILFFVTSLRVYHKTTDNELKIVALISLLSVFTYFIHGFLNNYLDTDKASVPFWGFIAIVCSIDIYYVKNKNPQLGGAEER